MSLTLQIYQASDVVAAGLSSGCANAFAASLNCSDLLIDPASSYTWAGLTDGNITNLCTQSCTESITAYRENLVATCGDQVYTDPVVNGTNASQPIYGTGETWNILNVNDVAAYPVALIDYWILNYKLNCMEDSSNPPVNCYLKSHTDSTDTTGAGDAFGDCDDCNLGAQYLQLQDPRFFSPDDASTFTSLTSSCGVTTFSPIASPTAVFLANNATDVYNGTAAACTGKTVAPGSTPCDEFAAQNSMSTANMLALNSLAGGCANWPGNLTAVCVENTCATYRVGQNDTCPTIASTYNISTTQFLAWNPSIDPLCLNLALQVGHMVCVGNPNGYVVPTSVVTGVPTLGPTVAAPVPTNADPQSNTDCGIWYNVNAGDYCALVCNKQAITLQDFYFLNPEIDANCTNLLLDISYCVAPVGAITTYPGYGGGSASTATINPTAGTIATSLPTATLPTYNITNTTVLQFPLANGSISGCFQVFENDWGMISCEDAANNFGVSVNSFVLWNPSLGNWTNPPDPCTLQNETSYCGSFYNSSLVPVGSDLVLDQSADSPAPNSTAECYDWWFTESGDTCQSICNETNIAFADFFSWNPSIGASCTNLWLDYSYCVMGPGWQNSSYESATAPASTASQITTSATAGTSGPPAPTQSGIASNCDQYYEAVTGDTCDAIANKYDITFATFLQLNPAVKSDCSGLLANEAYCVDAPGISHTSATLTSTAPTSTGEALPGPTQSGIVSDCNSYADAVSGDGCYSFAQRNNITLTQLYNWNDILNNNCDNFFAGDAYCIGIS